MLCSCARATWQNRTSIITVFVRRTLRRSMQSWPPQPKPPQKRRLSRLRQQRPLPPLLASAHLSRAGDGALAIVNPVRTSHAWGKALPINLSKRFYFYGELHVAKSVRGADV